MIRVGLLGLGFMGRGHFDRYQQLADVQVTAIADAEPERRQGRLLANGNIDLGLKELDLAGIAVYADAQELVERADVDVVDVCLPTHLHSRLAVAALQAGKHVLCEKPMAPSLREADAMIAAAQASGRTLMIAQCIRFWPEYTYLTRTLREGTLGKLLSLRLTRSGTAPRWSWQGWMLDADRSGGALLDLHIHDVDYVHSLLGKPQAILAQGGNSGATTGYDIVSAAYQYDAVPRVSVEGAWMRAGWGFRAGYEALFEEGLLTYAGWQAPTLTLYRPGAEPATPEDFESGDAYVNEIRYFADCVASGQAPTRCPPQEARDSLALALKEKESIEKRALVRL
ncbi:MAG: Gfo/Idh/MocA family oxidoreductase [Chloroflexi bacterium]|nr:Gfo/Idh/MocA family oxidoreductase [Chloroflexota bacterium]